MQRGEQPRPHASAASSSRKRRNRAARPKYNAQTRNRRHSKGIKKSDIQIHMPRGEQSDKVCALSQRVWGGIFLFTQERWS